MAEWQGHVSALRSDGALLHLDAPIWFCKGCKKQFTVKVGTIFEDSALGMDKWMIAVWLIVNCQNGISSYEVARALGITQKSAWFMMHRFGLRCMKVYGNLGSGQEIEADETFIGGKARNMHPAKRKRARSPELESKTKPLSWVFLSVAASSFGVRPEPAQGNTLQGISSAHVAAEVRSTPMR